MALNVGLFVLDVDSGIMVGKVVQDGLENGKSRIVARGDAEVDCSLFAGVGLLESCGKTGIEMGVKARDGAENGDMGNLA